MVHALAGRHQVDTLTMDGWSPAVTNTSIPEPSIARLVVARPWRWLSRLPPHRLYRLQMAALLRHAGRIHANYDLLVTADDYAVFPRPGIQYVHYPPAVDRVPNRVPALVGAYFRFCDQLIGAPWSRTHDNLTLTNSCWTAERLSGGGETRVLYPPVIDTGPGEPWASRPNTFLCVGRFTESKRIEVVMAIVRRLRAQAIPDARLIVVGSAVSPAYSRTIKETAARLGNWIEIREDLSRRDLSSLMAQSRYAIQAMEGEHFGMATAELVRAGCLVFPHRSGGSVEVVDHASEVLWDDEDEAVARVSAIATDAALRDPVLARLRPHGLRFSSDRFVEEFRAIVSSRVR
jgi:glycosyltransferase involved in cell wall biosynthesis